MPIPSASALPARFGPFEVDFRAGELLKNGRRIRLQDQPLQVLVMLLEHPGNVVTRDEFRQKLWPNDTFVDFDHGLNNAINRLREALRDSADNPRFVETLPRRGYRFIASVEAAAGTIGQTSPNASPGPAPKLPEAASAENLEAPIAGLTRLRRRPRKFWFVAAALGVVAAAFVSVSLSRWGMRLWRRHPAAAPVRSLAVLPFENLTGDPNQEYFVDGVSDALITDLAQIGSLRVISRTSVTRYKTARRPLSEIAKELNVDAVVEGTVARSADRVRVDAQLIQAATDRHLWARSYERDMRDILALRNDVAQAIAQEVEVQLTPQDKARLGRSKPVNPEAYEAYLKGSYYLHFWTSEGFSRAIEHFHQAIQQDPTYAPAYAGLSDSYRFLALVGPAPPREFMPKAEAAAVKALQLDDSQAEAHSSLAGLKFRFYWNWAGADAEYRRALQLNPNSAEGHGEYSVFLRTAGRFEEAIVEAKRALELDPLSSEKHRPALGFAYFIARQYDSAIAELRRSLAMNPEQPLVHHFLGSAYEQKGDSQAAIAELEESVRISKRDPIYVAGLAHAYAVFGRKEEAEKLRAELEQRSRREYVSPYGLALVWIGLGDKQKALAWLEKAYADRSFALVMINSLPLFDPLRSDPHFQDLVRRIGLNPERAIPH